MSSDKSEKKVIQVTEDSDSASPSGNGEMKAQPAKKTKVTQNKIKALKVDLEKAQQENVELRDRLLRTAAEFDNYKKRREAEYGQIVANANAQLLAALLPVVDDLERSVQSARAATDKQSIVEGMELIQKNFMKVLEAQGVKAIDAVGTEFDPEKHEALMQVDSQDHASGTVVEEHLKGYLMNDRVLRHSQVLVSK